MCDALSIEINISVGVKVIAANTHDLGRLLREISSLEEEEFSNLLVQYLNTKIKNSPRRLDW